MLIGCVNRLVMSMLLYDDCDDTYERRGGGISGYDMIGGYVDRVY